MAGGLIAIAFDAGGYSLTNRNAVAVSLLWLLAVAAGLALWPKASLPLSAVAVITLFGGFTAWVGLSILWSPSAEKSFAEFDRSALYLGLLAVVVVSTARAAGLHAWLRGIAFGIAVVGLLALVSRLFPEQFEGTAAVGLAQLYPAAGRRLNYPLEYWNALATLIALGLPLLLWAATTERRAVVRALALLPLPALTAALYLTSSRGGIAVSVFGVAVFAALARRWRAVTAVAAASVASAVAILAVRSRDALVEGPLTPGAATEGRGAAIVIAVSCLAAAVAYGMLSSLRVELGRSGRPLGWGVALALLLMLGVGAVAVDPVERFEQFKALPAAPTAENQSVGGHLADLSGNGRWQLWEAAVEQFRDHPLIGAGAGTYESWWAENGTLAVFVRDAHSLYLEILGELGIVGLALLAGALLVGLATGIRRSVLADTETRVACAALTAAYTAWLVESGTDWMWESTVVTLVAIACLGLLVGPATSSDVKPVSRSRPRRLATRIAVPAIALALVAAQVIPLLSQLAIERSQAAVRDGRIGEAVDAAAAAQKLQPWAATPHLQRALVEELEGDLPAARVAIGEALERDTRDWRLWLVDARVETKLENFEAAAQSLRRAIELNPRSDSFEGMPGAIG